MSLSPIISALRRQMAAAQEAIDGYQEDCIHIHHHVDRVSHSDGDDYGRGCRAVRYWYECHCTWCGKHWEEPQ